MNFPIQIKILANNLIGSIGIGLALCSLSPAAEAFTVNRGTDYLVTPSNGAVFTFVNPFPGAGSVTINFQGLPIGTPTATPPDGGFTGVADTVVNRNNDVTSSGGITPIEIVGLSLKSVNPVLISGSKYDVFAGLQKYYPLGLGGGTLSTGTMTIRGNDSVSAKTWDSQFSIAGVAVLAPEGTLVPTGTDYVKRLIEACPGSSYQCILFEKGIFTAFNEPWSETPGAGQFMGVNLVEPGLPQNFYLTAPVFHDAGDGTIHEVIPTPGPLAILGAPAVLASMGRIKKLSSRVKAKKICN